MSRQAKNRFTGILGGWDEIIRDHYGLKHEVTTKSAAREAYHVTPDLTALFEALFAQIERNLSSSPSPRVADSNWNLRRAEKISTQNASLEKLLEKRVVSLSSDLGGRNAEGEWFNQVPAGSGFASSSSNRKNSIDLVYRCGDGKEYAFIELKVCNKSGTPFYATFENLSYGFLYLVTRTNKRLGAIFAKAVEKPILEAERIQLIILAPEGYYGENKPFHSQLKQFERSVRGALVSFVRSRLPELEMGFEFRQFVNPVSSVEEINRFEGFEPAPYGELVPFDA